LINTPLNSGFLEERGMFEAFNWLHWLLDLRFLPDKIQNWLFETGTRAIEVFSGLAMLGFAFTFLLAEDKLYRVDIYEKFQHLHKPTLVCILVCISVLQLGFAVIKSYRLKLVSSFLLMFSSLIWAVITGMFIAGYPPVSTGMTTYAVFTIICCFAGLYLNRHAKRLEDKVQDKGL
jgi:hypothetical protein